MLLWFVSSSGVSSDFVLPFPPRLESEDVIDLYPELQFVLVG